VRAISWQAVGHGGGLGDDGEGGGSGEGGGLRGDDDRSGWLSDLLPSDAERPASPKCKKAHHAPQQSKSPTAATLRQRQSGALRGFRRESYCEGISAATMNCELQLLCKCGVNSKEEGPLSVHVERCTHGCTL
jgi:hypothetical protein